MKHSHFELKAVAALVAALASASAFAGSLSVQSGPISGLGFILDRKEPQD